MSLAGIARAYGFIGANATIIAHHLDGGVPWGEALRDAPFPRHLRDNWRDRLARTPKGMPVFLSLTPLSAGRDGLAPYWSGRGENQPLPAGWAGKALDDSEVVRAYTTYVLRAVEAFDPAYLAIGIEVNMLAAREPELWPAYLSLNAQVYAAVKAAHPALPVFASVQYEYLRGKDEATQFTAAEQRAAVGELMRHSDLLALSTYRYGILHPNPPVKGYFDMARRFGKPLAIAESGASAAPVTVNGTYLPAYASTQTDFLAMLLAAAEAQDFAFVINWTGVDYDGLVADLPPAAQDVARAWMHMGLESYDGKARPALALWRRCLGQ